MEKSIVIRKKVGNSVYDILPKTSAGMVTYSGTDGTGTGSVADTLTAILNKIAAIEESLASDSLYATDSSGALIVDEEGTDTNVVLLSKSIDSSSTS